MKLVLSLACLLLACAAGETVSAQGVRSELKPIAFSTLDTNHDGKISRSEARADPGLDADFDMLDVNHDGFLSPQEFQAWPRAMKTKDAATRDPTTAPSGSAGAQHMPPQ
jgi:Ca2+-binding EF-hand superfamily protein